MGQPETTSVLYNETCPVCRVEIDAYRRRALETGAPLRFDTLDQAARYGITPDAAARRLHVLRKGQVLSGLPAFQAMWSELPGWRHLARVTALPVVHPVLAAVYDHVLAPVLYRAHLRRTRQAR